MPDLDADQLADLRALAANPRHALGPMRRKTFRRRGLIVPIEPPRAARDRPGRERAPKPRAHALTEAGRIAIAAIQDRVTP